MNFNFDTSLVENYKSNSQKIRVMSETWVGKNIFCPVCGNPHISNLDNNMPVADLQCDKGCMVPMSFDVMKIFQDAGFTLKELIIKEQHNCKATGYWKTNSVKYNFLLIAHEYLFVFRK